MPFLPSGKLDSLEVLPANGLIGTGETRQFSAVGTYSDGKTRDLTDSATWSSSDDTLATVNSAGLVTGASNTTGPVIITATSAGISGMLVLKVIVQLPKTGQTTCYDDTGSIISCNTTTGAGQDAALRKGVAWPSTRFTSNADTTILDNLTGLIWAPNGNIMPTRDNNWDQDGTVNDGKVTWQHALDYIAKLNDENYLGHADWRLPNRKELNSLINYGQSDNTAWLNSNGFTGVQGTCYWSSTTSAKNAASVWYVDIQYGYVYAAAKTNPNCCLLPVRSPQ